MKNYIYLIIVLFSLTACSNSTEKTAPFIHIQDGQFYKGEKPYHYIGTNYWYAPIIGCADAKLGSDRDRLIKELDIMKESGMDNLRIMVGSDGISNHFSHLDFPLQTSPGEYNEVYLEGLDFVLEELRKREMYAVLFLTNNWDWSGGLAQYVNWVSDDPYPYFKGEEYSYNDFKNYVARFHKNETAMTLFDNHIRFILNRENSISGMPYKDDPAIMAWEVANEPRPFLKDNEPFFEDWIIRVTSLIKSIDKKHLVTLGSEGQAGCNDNIELWEQYHSLPHVDYSTIHIWAKNWSWIDSEDIEGTLSNAKENASRYMANHISIARKLNKPLVLEEFGLPRDHHSFSPSATVTQRDEYFEFLFDLCVENKSVIQGINIWAYGGIGRSPETHEFWVKGDDLLGDPPQEEQGLNNVFDTDHSTIALIKEYNELIRN